MSLLVTMFAIAGLYALMEAYLLALFQIIIYIGAILVLFAFVVMLLNLKGTAARSDRSWGAWAFVLSSAVLTLGLGWLVWQVLQASTGSPAGRLRASYSAAQIAVDLFRRHLLVFELTSVLLFAAVVGAVYMTRKEKDPS